MRVHLPNSFWKHFLTDCSGLGAVDLLAWSVFPFLIWACWNYYNGPHVPSLRRSCGLVASNAVDWVGSYFDVVDMDWVAIVVSYIHDVEGQCYCEGVRGLKLT